MTRNHLQALAAWLRLIVLHGLRERTEKQSAGLWDYGEDSLSLTCVHGTFKTVTRLLWKKTHTH